MTNILETIKGKFKQKQFSARDAYMTAKYDKIFTCEQLLEQFFENTEDLIRTKAQAGQFCAMTEIDTDISQYTDTIVNHYVDAGYQVLPLTDTTTIDGKVLSELKSTYIILIWSNLKYCDKINNDEQEWEG